MDQRAFTENARALERYHYLDELLKINFEVLFLVGDKDSLITEALLKPTVQRIKNARIEVLKDTGHAVNVQNPDQFVTILTDFLKEKKI